MREKGELSDHPRALHVTDGLLFPVRPFDGDPAHQAVALIRGLVKGDAREAPVLSLPDELEVPHVHGILSPRKALHGDGTSVAAFALTLAVIVVLVVVVVEIFVSAVILGLNSRLIQ